MRCLGMKIEHYRIDGLGTYCHPPPLVTPCVPGRLYYGLWYVLCCLSEISRGTTGTPWLLYQHLLIEFQLQTYLKLPMQTHYIKEICKIRICAHKLNLELGRYRNIWKIKYTVWCQCCRRWISFYNWLPTIQRFTIQVYKNVLLYRTLTCPEKLGGGGGGGGGHKVISQHVITKTYLI